MTKLLDDLLNFYSTFPEWEGDKCLTPFSRNKFGDYPLNVAATRGLIEEMEILLKSGADINLKGEHGYSALHNGVESGSLEAVQFLINHGADILQVNDHNISSIQLSDYLDEVIIKDYLSKRF
ncbi:ankyrin repeat domain-containing protein [Parasulfitobacter algicola]|uniref:Ankyrin repeat domain-containing protein n=1 Tax=Parasulfitobacter algicola TaxID=2614809 RepID=A0ABX2IVL0_9RHOB|nr:ankyrin repeat domain-containing protein [Sulfitobacter algicola]NSX56943.1 ankyrin repeat domain-containing protein [Sulfitobacter algicola]